MPFRHREVPRFRDPSFENALVDHVELLIHLLFDFGETNVRVACRAAAGVFFILGLLVRAQLLLREHTDGKEGKQEQRTHSTMIKGAHDLFVFSQQA